MTIQPLKIFIVDDNPGARMIIGSTFGGPDYLATEYASGEACLAALDQAPDVVLMDVEMPGMDGIAACRALREAGNTLAHVIFISAHDDMETRMRAYDAGGNDYMVKPFAPEELEQKVQVAKQLLERQRGVERQSHVAQQTAFTAMSSMGELAVVLQFMQASFACQTGKQLGEAIFSALEQYGLDGLLELRESSMVHRASRRGECSPLEVSILRHAKGMERIFQFRDRLVINYPLVTLVIVNLPMEDPDRVGRLRDHLTALAEGANARMAAMLSESERVAQASGISQAANELATSTEEIESRQAEIRLRCLDIMGTYVLALERSFVHLGLTEAQERVLSNNARETRDQVGELLGESKETADRLRKVAARLQQLIA